MFVDKETNGSYPFENGLNGLAGLNILMVLTLALLVTHVVVGQGILLYGLDILLNFHLIKCATKMLRKIEHCGIMTETMNLHVDK